MVLVSVRTFCRHGLKSGRDSSHASGSNDKPRPLTGRALKYKLFVQIAEDETNGAIVAEATGWMFELRLEGYAMHVEVAIAKEALARGIESSCGHQAATVLSFCNP